MLYRPLYFYLFLTIVGISIPFLFWFDTINPFIVFLNTVFWLGMYLAELVNFEFKHLSPEDLYKIYHYSEE